MIDLTLNNIDSISSDVSNKLELTLSFTQKCLAGLATKEDVNKYEKYDDLFRMRHDAIHWLICQHRGLPFGERHIEDIDDLKVLQEYEHWDDIKRQSPDSILISGSQVNIMELTVSGSRLAEKEKITKYSILISALKRYGFSVQLEVIVISASTSPLDEEFLSNHHGFNSTLINDIRLVVENMNKLILDCESTLDGQEWHLRRRGIVFSDVELGVTNEMILNHYDNNEIKVFHDRKELEDILSNDFSSDDENDEDFLNTVVDESMNLKSIYLKGDDLTKSVRKLLNHHDDLSNTNHLRSFLPLPYMISQVIDSSIRNTDQDMGDLVLLKSDMKLSDDAALHLLAGMVETQEKVDMPQSVKVNIALQGPGRKRYIKNGFENHIKEQKKTKNFWFNPQTSDYQHDLDRLMRHLSVKTGSLEKMEGPGLQYVKCCQSIYREIALNAMRADRRREYIFKPTGVSGIFLIMFPGAKLRTGEAISQIWFKLITSRSFMIPTEWSNHWAFRAWRTSGPIYQTDWMSIDANRLDHYLRCSDRIIMGYLSTQQYSGYHLSEASDLDQSDTLGVIISIYMEDKRSTSKMLQDVRYTVMCSLSIYHYWDSVISKFSDPIRTPLQALLLMRVIYYCQKMDSDMSDYTKLIKFGRVYHDGEVNNISDKLAGSVITLPRVLTKGPDFNFQGVLSEMYYCMLFNKNQDDPTHATFQILSKILEGEESLHEVKATSGLHMGGRSIEDDIHMIRNPHKNQFSRRAIELGSKLQSLSIYNRSPNGLAHRKASQDKFLDKPLSEFATYKSSSVLKNTVYNPDVLSKKVNYKKKHADALEPEFREEEDDVDIEPKFPRQNPRRRCIEGIIELVQEGYSSSFQIINKSIQDDLYFQIFKKNQIGGTREILILPIDKRITINILESFSRLICREDDREMLTHGSVKVTTMRDMIRDLRRADTKRLIMNYNFDKTRWGPSFMPIQFLYMFTPFKHHYPSLFRFLLMTLMSHSNKKCLIPEKLIKIWLQNPTLKHSDSNLQRVKEKFLIDKKLYIQNESNMGQGILHYTSSYLHLCAISFRDEIYKRLCARYGVTTGEWRDIVSSDDSFTAQALPMDSIIKSKLRIELFIRAQESTERLFNMWTSKSKSSISPLIYEFNSMFGSNLTLYPTLFKFAIAATSPVNTDSFFRMVKESYNTTRQIVENGGSLELYQVAHRLNKIYCESMYHTYPGGANDPMMLNVDPSNMPYHLGTYPIGDPAMMVILGPEFHNYSIVDRISELNQVEKKLLMNSHSLIDVSHPEVFADMVEFDDIFTGMLRIEAAMGPVKKLQTIKRQIDTSWEEMNKTIMNDPLILFRKPVTLEEVKLSTYLKLFAFGSSEALRATAPSIYYARVSATVTAQAFQIPYHEGYTAKRDKVLNRLVGHTYYDCLKHLCERDAGEYDLTKYYPYMREFKDLQALSCNQLTYSIRNPLETQNIRSLQLTEVTMRIKNPVREVLETFWSKNSEDHPTSMIRDWINLKEILPILGDSLATTLENFSGDKEKQIRNLILVLLRLSGYSSKPMKAVIYGPSSRTYDQSYLSLTQYNMYQYRSSKELVVNETADSNPRMYDKLYYSYNFFMISLWKGKDVDVRDQIDMNVVNAYCRDQYISYSSKKKIFIMLMYCGMVEDIKSWTRNTKMIVHHWIKRQRREGDNYYGVAKLQLQCGNNSMIVSQFQDKRISVIMSTVENASINYDMLSEAAALLQLDINKLSSKCREGHFVITSNKIICVTTKSGVDIKIQPINDLFFYPDKIIFQNKEGMQLITLIDRDGYQVMSTPIGLLATDYVPLPGEYEEVLFNGMKLSQLSLLRIFSENFSFDYVPREKCLEVISDLKVDKPKVSKTTKERLNKLIGEDWPEKDWSDEMLESKIVPVEEEIINPHDTFLDLLNVDISEIDLTNALTSDVESFEDYFNPDIDINLINSLSTTMIKFQPAILWDRFINVKYSLIARSCVDLHHLSQGAIRWILKVTKSKEIAYSLIYMYDKMYSTTDIVSPRVINVNAHEDFLDKFNLQIESERL
jgi:hypothetical protein